jgi:hypothetical protein
MNLIVKLPPVRLTDINTDGTDKRELIRLLPFAAKKLRDKLKKMTQK